ncbi:uracil-DNA glycosylase [Evansella sp. AB-P1]|uniref:uracil-DNA glycosylase n=1 Tax=Evansella sp. AB-P1 TaxID=3037653 RepID=UPI00241FD6AC|nr:uracil-DNA glycosylase [Evansella sp. AB-P1]MDG5787123.1 uracil-DNA glycosylase [Evansella sp. AB-P1]
MSFAKLNEEIIQCKKCHRLRNWCERQQGERKEFKNDDYWSLPVPSFGDPNAQLLIVGLAPAAHGANRTGRVFTGDTSGSYLLNALYDHGFSNSFQSKHRNDQLKLNNVYITNIVKCAPPQNKPTAKEFQTCRGFFEREIQQLKNLKVILCLGGDAFNQTKRLFKQWGVNVTGLKFGHGVSYDFGNKFPLLIGSYHPSKYNVQTKRLTRSMLNNIFLEVKKMMNSYQKKKHT